MQLHSSSQMQTQRAGRPVFDMIIELQRGKVNTWSVIRNVGSAVDALLSGNSYEVERRTTIAHDSDTTAKVYAVPSNLCVAVPFNARYIQWPRRLRAPVTYLRPTRVRSSAQARNLTPCILFTLRSHVCADTHCRFFSCVRAVIAFQQGSDPDDVAVLLKYDREVKKNQQSY